MTNLPPTMEELEARVAKGAALIDEKYPQLWFDIDTDVLSIASGAFCMTAQTYKLYGNLEKDAAFWIKGAEMYGLTAENSYDYMEITDYILHGFNAESGPQTESDDDLWDDYSYNHATNILSDLWLAEIEKRRNAV